VNGEPTWRKSSYSDSESSNCVEMAADPGAGTVLVRDSKLGAQAPRMTVPAAAWQTFLHAAVFSA
jgi:hypothetical protein